MILARDSHPSAARCFEELNAAVEAMTWRRVAFNAHNALSVPSGVIIYNLESIPDQADPSKWEGHEIWDGFESNLPKYPAGMNVRHVPVGYHPSMQRFERASTLDIDVAFCGALNERRSRVLEGLRAHGLRVEYVGPHPQNYGGARDALLARAKLALNMLFHDDAPFPATRCAHLVANRVPVLSEWSCEAWPWLTQADYGRLVSVAVELLERGGVDAEQQLSAFQAMPMVLPS